MAPVTPKPPAKVETIGAGPFSVPVPKTAPPAEPLVLGMSPQMCLDVPAHGPVSGPPPAPRIDPRTVAPKQLTLLDQRIALTNARDDAITRALKEMGFASMEQAKADPKFPEIERIATQAGKDAAVDALKKILARGGKSLGKDLEAELRALPDGEGGKFIKGIAALAFVGQALARGERIGHELKIEKDGVIIGIKGGVSVDFGDKLIEGTTGLRVEAPIGKKVKLEVGVDLTGKRAPEGTSLGGTVDVKLRF